MRSMSRREHYLLLAALLGVTALILFGVRYRPHAARLAGLDDQRRIAEARLAGAKWPADRGEPKRLSADCEELRAEVEKLEESLRREEARFVSRRTPASMDELRVRISELAQRHRIRLHEHRSCAEQELRAFLGRTEGDAASLVRFLALGEPYALRARAICFESDFAGLRGFLRDLAALEQQVVVLRFEIAAVAAPRLEVKLVLIV